MGKVRKLVFLITLKSKKATRDTQHAKINEYYILYICQSNTLGEKWNWNTKKNWLTESAPTRQRANFFDTATYNL